MDRQSRLERDPLPMPMRFDSSLVPALEFQNGTELMPWINRQLANWNVLHEQASGTEAATRTGQVVHQFKALRETIASDSRGSNFAKSERALSDGS